MCNALLKFSINPDTSEAVFSKTIKTCIKNYFVYRVGTISCVICDVSVIQVCYIYVHIYIVMLKQQSSRRNFQQHSIHFD